MHVLVSLNERSFSDASLREADVTNLVTYAGFRKFFFEIETQFRSVRCEGEGAVPTRSTGERVEST
jgi:hypothetical protein